MPVHMRAVPFVARCPGGAGPKASRRRAATRGVGVSYSTPIKTNNELQKVFIIDSAELLEATEWAIGVSRGQLRGGHWTVRYVSKP